MNELDKLIELAGIIVGAADSRGKKDDVGITINDLPINGEEETEMPPVGGIEVAQTIPNDHEIAFSVDQSHDQECDGYEDFGFGGKQASPAVTNFKVGEQEEVDEELQRMQQLAGMKEAGYQSPTAQHVGGGSKQFEQDLARFISIVQEKGMSNIDDIKGFADKIIKKQGIQAFDGVHAEYVAKAAMAKMGIKESDEDDVEAKLPPAKVRDAKPEPDYEKEYDKNLNWWGKDDVEEGIDDDEGEILDFEPNAEDDEDIFSDKPRVRDAKPEPDFNKKYDDWYWSGKGEKFEENDDLSNGYGDEEEFEGIGLPNGFGSPIQDGKGPAGAKHGDNPLARQSRTAVKESIKKSLYQELINFKK